MQTLKKNPVSVCLQGQRRLEAGRRCLIKLRKYSFNFRQSKADSFSLHFRVYYYHHRSINSHFTCSESVISKNVRLFFYIVKVHLYVCYNICMLVGEERFIILRKTDLWLLTSLSSSHCTLNRHKNKTTWLTLFGSFSSRQNTLEPFGNLCFSMASDHTCQSSQSACQVDL